MSDCISCLPMGSSRVFNEKPGGLFDCINLTYTTATKFYPESLIIRLDGIALDPAQYTIDINEMSFTLLVNANDSKSLSCPPASDECLRVDYNKKPDTDCITLL
jgi:hypothetical protein